MNTLALIRHPQNPWAGRVFGLFVVVWLNMTFQTCAMAFGDSGEEDCLHCPPVQTMAMQSHDMQETGAHEHRGMPCDMYASQCAFLDDYQYDGRTVKIKTRDAPVDIPIIILSVVPDLPVPRFVVSLPRVAKTKYPPGHQPPLNVLNCVYLK